MLEVALGASRILARPGDRRLCVLNPAAGALWDLHAAGLEPERIAGWLTRRFGLAESAARAQVESQFAGWRDAGLFDSDADPPPTSAPGFEADDLSLPAPVLAPAPAGAWRLRLGGRSVSLSIEAPELRQCLAPLIALLREKTVACVAYRLHLRGVPSRWTLQGNGVVLAAGTGADGALVMTLDTLTEIGYRPTERLMVIHGAGLKLGDGRGLLLIAPGGAGKTTLAAALNAEGFGLLSDDVVPVTPDGDLVGLGMPLCLKAGSWPVLASRRPDLAKSTAVWRYGEPVRYLRPRRRRVRGPLPPGLVLFPRFQPDTTPHVESLAPEAVLQGVVEAEAVIRDLTQPKLEAIARWISATPAHALSYPDLDSGLALVRWILAGGIGLDQPGAPVSWYRGLD